ncbi:alpha/beta hydrolase [Rhodococcus rhodnii]|uniref:Alpha/beta hydrolase n=1 Tax=Rhodococcus rhodnii TaxID=38312 RepID=A0A6P2CI81_9NOCA|nr:alpha/beta hydrolase [Rhodococcus rhodnii]
MEVVVRRTVLALGIAAVLVSGGCSSEPTDDDATPGTLLSTTIPGASAVLPSAGYTTLVTYTSENAVGAATMVSGTVSVPSSPPPEGGYPVLSWAHGTSGYADACAPSADFPGGPVHDYFSIATAMLDEWVRAGYAVVQTDYEGLGTPGGHPYMNGASAANTVVDIVRAAREHDDDIGASWIVAGHSQGGQAALFTAEAAAERAPELDLRGAVAIAPGGIGLARTVEYVQAGGPGAEAAEAFVPLLVLGAEAADPTLRADEILTTDAAPLLDAARTGCLADLREVPAIAPRDVFRADTDLAALGTYLDAQDPSTTRPAVPTMIVQGSADVLVPQSDADALAQVLCGTGDVGYRVYDGADHRSVLDASLADVVAFAESAVQDRAVTGGCAVRPHR